MTVWIIEPHDPLIFRDGRPFGPTPGARATSLPFPFPSTTAGAVRTQAGMSEEGIFAVAHEALPDLKAISMRGPLLIQLAQHKGATDEPLWMAPAPADAVFFDDPERSKKHGLLKQLLPMTVPEGMSSDLDDLPEEKKLWLIGLREPEQQHKPLNNPPRYWRWPVYKAWLASSTHETARRVLSEVGHNGPERELRVHLAMDSVKGMAREGALFDTSGMEFAHHEESLERTRRLALAVKVNDLKGFELHEGPGYFGSERRIVNWRRGPEQLPPCPPELIETISEQPQPACRVSLLTPAYFEEGYRPVDLLKPRHGVRPTLKAIAIRHPQVVSGYDMQEGEPRATRRLAPAGTVFFLTLEGQKEHIGTWLESIWMRCISDQEQDRRDGFGLAAVGAWSGERAEYEWGKYA